MAQQVNSATSRSAHKRWEYFIKRPNNGNEFAVGKIYWCVCKQCDEAFKNGDSNVPPKFIRGRNEQMDNHLFDCAYTQSSVMTWATKDTISKSKRLKVSRLAAAEPFNGTTAQFNNGAHPFHNTLDNNECGNHNNNGVHSNNSNNQILGNSSIEHQSYFNNTVQSLVSTRHGRKFSVGIILPGMFTFTAECPERISVISGFMLVSFECSPSGGNRWITFPAGTNFEVAGDSKFTVRVSDATAFECEYLPGPQEQDLNMSVGAVVTAAHHHSVEVASEDQHEHHDGVDDHDDEQHEIGEEGEV